VFVSCHCTGTKESGRKILCSFIPLFLFLFGCGQPPLVFVLAYWAHCRGGCKGGGGTPLYGLYRYVRPQIKGYGFSAVFFIKRVSIFGYIDHK